LDRGHCNALLALAVAEVGGRTFVVGGFGGQRELEIYDPSGDHWTRGASIPRALHHTAAVGLNGKLYVVGGFVEGWTPTDDVHEYDPPSDRWQRLAALPTPRGALAAAVLGGKIYAVGGVGSSGRNDRRFRKVFPRFDFTEFGAGLSATVAYYQSILPY
jgi:N-acetylneuraminic acid mutarotase